MFDLTSSKLLILAIVALVVVGPKDLPVLLRTLGRYLGMIRRHATEFRAQFDEAMRDAELAELRKEVNAMHDDMTKSIEEARSSVNDELSAAQRDVDNALATPETSARPALGDETGGTTGETTHAGAGEPGADQGHAKAEALPKPALTPHPGVQDMKSGA